MPKNFVRKTFDRWLAQNRKHFTHQPRIVLKRKDFFILRFSGIAQQIKCFISKSGAFEIHAEYQKEYWDIIWEFDVFETRTADGRYYCHLCLAKHCEMFSSRKEMWEKHCFEELLEWVNDNFKTCNWICLHAIGKGSTDASLINEKDLGKSINCHETFVRAFPVIKKGMR